MANYIIKTIDQLIPALADHFLTIANESLTKRGAFNVALSGGNSPGLLYQLLTTAPYRDQLDWKQVNFFFGDERNVLPDSEQNNANMARRVLFTPLNIPESKIFAVDTTLPPDKAARAYSTMIRQHFQGKHAVFDLVLLGLGDNAHTASLFPGTDVLQDQHAEVKEVWLKDQKRYRITMTAPLINQARNIAFLVYGADKARAVHHVIKGDRNVDEYPAQLIHSERGKLVWFLDPMAASLLND